MLDDMDNPLNRSYSSAASMSSAGTGNASSSSKAVLAALRALQDKIRRLEAERTQALDETTQLRHQLKNQELEAEHNRQKEQMASQKSLQEVRGAYDRLLTEKSELEVRLTHLEEKNRQAQQSSDEMQEKIRRLEEQKHASMLRVKELEGQQQQIELRIRHAQQKEQDLAHSLTMESRRHEDTVYSTQQRLAAVQEELAHVCRDKGLADAKLIELDQLVTQLLSVNESLVAQMSGRPARLDSSVAAALSNNSSSSLVKKKKKAAAAAAAPLVPRAASATTTALEAGRVEKFSKRQQGSQLVPVNLGDIEQLKSMHKMYATMAKNIHKSVEALGVNTGRSGGGSSSSGKKKVSKKASAAGSAAEPKKVKSNTRLSRKKAAANVSGASAGSSSSSSAYKGPAFNYDSSMNGNGSNMDIRLPKPSVSFDHDRLDVSDTEDSGGNYFLHQQQQQQLGSSRQSSQLPPQPPSSSSGGGGGGIGYYDASMVSSVVDSHRDKAELQAVINSLEQEFDELNSQYKKLLSNVQAAPSGSAADVSIIPSASAASAAVAAAGAGNSSERIQAQAEEIVDVIRKLHKKGEQLRQLKGSP